MIGISLSGHTCGFSKPLDGPLLTELFEWHRLERVRQSYRATSDKAAEAWENLYERLSRVFSVYNTSTNHGQRAPWRNPEEYVELLGLAAEGNARAVAFVTENLQRDHKDDVRRIVRELSSLSNDACIYLAAVTHEFMHETDVASERWDPYLRWSRRIRSQDRIVTFNYDLVAERAYLVRHQEEIRRSVPGVVDPQIFKPHGSVDWRLIRSLNPVGAEPPRFERLEPVSDPFSAMAVEDYVPGIGVPGPGKFRASREAFRGEWDGACAALREADVVVFVGYRFPETDNYAKRKLLGAIRANKRPLITIRIVLGPERNEDVKRLEGMLSWHLSERRNIGVGARTIASGAREYRIVHEPMWAQDFLAVFDRERLA